MWKSIATAFLLSTTLILIAFSISADFEENKEVCSIRFRTLARLSVALPGELLKLLNENQGKPSGPHRKLVKRTNFAASEGGAHIVETNPGARYASALLSNEEDRYLINSCNGEKWFVVSLSEDIQIDTFLLLSREQYSSYIKDFELFGSVDYPKTEWFSLGRFRANNTKEFQTFTLERPAWVRFIKLVYLSHYDDEEFCTLTQIKVYGSTMLSSLKEDMNSYSAYMDNISNISEVMKKKQKEAEIQTENLIKIEEKSFQNAIERETINVGSSDNSQQREINLDLCNASPRYVAQILFGLAGTTLINLQQQDEQKTSLMRLTPKKFFEFDPSESLFSKLTKHLILIESSLEILQTELREKSADLNTFDEELSSLRSYFRRLSLEQRTLVKQLQELRIRENAQTAKIRTIEVNMKDIRSSHHLLSYYIYVLTLAGALFVLFKVLRFRFNLQPVSIEKEFAFLNGRQRKRSMTFKDIKEIE